MSSYKEICWKILVDRTEHAPICWRTLGSIILAICWLSLAICDGFTFLLMSPPEIEKKKIEWERGWEDIRFCYKKVIFVCPLAYFKYVPLSVHEKICRMVFDHGDQSRTEEILQGANLNSKEPKWTFSRAGKRANHKIDKAKQLIFVKRAKLPLNKPLIPPIFFTIAANLVYCDKSSCTSRTDTPQPRATRVERPGWRENSFAPLGLSSSENEKSRRVLTRKLKVSVNKPSSYSALHCTTLLNTIARAV